MAQINSGDVWLPACSLNRWEAGSDSSEQASEPDNKSLSFRSKCKSLPQYPRLVEEDRHVNTHAPTSTHKQSMHTNTHGHTPHTHTLMAEAQSSAIAIYAGSHIQVPLTKNVGGRNKAQGRPGLKKRAGLGDGQGAGDIEVQPEHRGIPQQPGRAGQTSEC